MGCHGGRCAKGFVDMDKVVGEVIEGHGSRMIPADKLTYVSLLG